MFAVRSLGEIADDGADREQFVRDFLVRSSGVEPPWSRAMWRVAQRHWSRCVSAFVEHKQCSGDFAIAEQMAIEYLYISFIYLEADPEENARTD